VNCEKAGIDFKSSIKEVLMTFLEEDGMVSSMSTFGSTFLNGIESIF
jgi:hypothetical protein